jgi:hypothetical protein
MTASGAAIPFVEPFDYALWTEILAVIVTPKGKVDYEVLAHRCALLMTFVAQLGLASPDATRPAAGPPPAALYRL